MKYSWVVTVLILVCLSVSGEVSEDQLKDFRHLVRIDSIRDYEGRSRANKKHTLEVVFSSENDGVEDILVRVAVEMTDRKTKQVYLAGKTRKFGQMPRNYRGEGLWYFTVPYGNFDRLKMTAYVVEFGVLDGDEFVPFLTECDHAESFDELTGRKAQTFPNSCGLSSMIKVH
jgi:hypothetical protein